MYLKREVIGKIWPVPRKGTTYLSVASHDKTKSVPLVIIMREVLGLVKNKKELQKLLNEKKVFINGKEIRDVKYPINLFDILSLPILKKNYKAILNNKKMVLEEISEKDAEKTIFKVMNKKILGKDKVQINLNNGKNVLADSKLKDVQTGDFAILSFKDNKILETIKLNKGSKVLVIKGKHIGVYGSIKDIHEEGHHDIAEIEGKEDKEIIKVNVNNLFAI